MLPADVARLEQEKLKRLSAERKAKTSNRLFGPAQARAQKLANAAAKAAASEMQQ